MWNKQDSKGDAPRLDLSAYTREKADRTDAHKIYPNRDDYRSIDKDDKEHLIVFAFAGSHQVHRIHVRSNIYNSDIHNCFRLVARERFQ